MSTPNLARVSRRHFLATTAAAGAASLLPVRVESKEENATDIGNRLELFLDDALIDRLAGKAELRLHQPVARELALVHDAPWEGGGSGYHSVFRDVNLFRMYYKAWQIEVAGGKMKTDAHPLYCCYAESDDGVHWRKPNLGLVDFRGSTENNIVLAPATMGPLNIDPGHPAVFKDDNLAAPEDARYKAIVRLNSPKGVAALKSPDGFHWSLMSETPILTDGAFDSQNLAFWDAARGEYRAYWRIFTKGIRAIRTATSPDFIHWDHQTDVQYVDSPAEHLYTNQVKPYPGAPHLLIGFPTRYTERPWSDSLRALPERQHRELRSAAQQRYGTAITEGLMMASRDGVTFKRWNEAFLPPGPERDGTWNYGHQYIAWHLIETPSSIEGAPTEFSLYAGERYWNAKGSALRRYTIRKDGFVSVRAPMSGGELITKPISSANIAGLTINFATSAAGSLAIEIQDSAGQPFPGFTLEDCPPIFGDTNSREVTWKQGGDLSKLSGRPIRLRFVLKDADLYSYRLSRRID